MSGKPDGGPANPTFPGQYDANGTWNEGAPGKSLRDWFAGRALVGLLSYPGDAQRGSANNNSTPSEVSAMAYGYADAMLAERAK